MGAYGLGCIESNLENNFTGMDIPVQLVEHQPSVSGASDLIAGGVLGGDGMRGGRRTQRRVIWIQVAI